MICPYLSLKEKLAFSCWRLLPTHEEATWTDNGIPSIVRTLVAAYRDADGRPLRSSTLIVHRTRGFYSARPTRRRQSALQLSLDFGVLDSNPAWKPPPNNIGMFTSTTDTTQLHAGLLDVRSRHIALSRGALVVVRTGGPKITSALRIQAPLELSVREQQLPDPDLLEGCFRTFSGATDRLDPVLSGRLRLGAAWLSKAWRNSPSIEPEDRLVLLKTAFEALTGESESWRSREQLVRIFRKLEDAGLTVRDVKDLIWSPGETATIEHKYRNKTALLTPMEHWYQRLCDTRNEIIHEGHVPQLTYYRRGSAYSGPYFFVGERLLREAIRVCLSSLGHHDLWRSSVGRRLHAIARRQYPELTSTVTITHTPDRKLT